MSAQIVIGMEARMMPVTSYVDAFYWTCEECGWLGTRLFSLNTALAEAAAHWREAHPLYSAPNVERKDQRRHTEGTEA